MFNKANPAWLCFWPTAGTFPPTETFLPVEIMWVSADGKRTRSSITSQEWKRQFFVTLFHGCHNTVHGSYRTSHYSDSALLCVAPRFDCGIHHHILDFWHVKKQVAEWSLCRCKAAQSEEMQLKALVDLSTFHLCTCVVVWKGRLGLNHGGGLKWKMKFLSSSVYSETAVAMCVLSSSISCIRKSSEEVSGHQSPTS